MVFDSQATVENADHGEDQFDEWNNKQPTILYKHKHTERYQIEKQAAETDETIRVSFKYLPCT